MGMAQGRTMPQQVPLSFAHTMDMKRGLLHLRIHFQPIQAIQAIQAIQENEDTFVIAVVQYTVVCTTYYLYGEENN